jgi:hypothetical protein
MSTPKLALKTVMNTPLNVKILRNAITDRTNHVLVFYRLRSEFELSVKNQGAPEFNGKR